MVSSVPNHAMRNGSMARAMAVWASRDSSCVTARPAIRSASGRTNGRSPSGMISPQTSSATPLPRSPARNDPARDSSGDPRPANRLPSRQHNGNPSANSQSAVVNESFPTNACETPPRIVTNTTRPERHENPSQRRANRMWTLDSVTNHPRLRRNRIPWMGQLFKSMGEAGGTSVCGSTRYHARPWETYT
jgi:hypothetical protein